jgi:hypothetical protein
LKTFIICISILSLSTRSISQELKTFRGFISYKFQLSNASRLNEEKKASVKRTMKQYAEREPLLTEYYFFLNKGDTAAAAKVLQKDKFFKNKDDFTIAYMFSIARMQTLNELFKPCIQVYDDEARGIIITCSKEQFDDLTDEETKIFEITCRFIGDLYVDNVKLYEMVRYR